MENFAENSNLGKRIWPSWKKCKMKQNAKIQTHWNAHQCVCTLPLTHIRVNKPPFNTFLLRKQYHQSYMMNYGLNFVISNAGNFNGFYQDIMPLTLCTLASTEVTTRQTARQKFHFFFCSKTSEIKFHYNVWIQNENVLTSTNKSCIGPVVLEVAPKILQIKILTNFNLPAQWHAKPEFSHLWRMPVTHGGSVIRGHSIFVVGMCHI